MPDHPLSPGGTTLAVLDTCVLLPPRLSDVLFDLHLEGLYSPHWTKAIEAEFLKNWRAVVKNAPPGSNEKRLACFRAATGNAHEIFGYDRQKYTSLVPPKVDSGDAHVISAALVLRDAAEAGLDRIVVVTSNITHMPKKVVGAIGIDVMRPGEFIDNLCKASPDRVEAALQRTIKDLKSPPYTNARLLGTLKLHKAAETARTFSKRWGVIPDMGMEGPTR